MGSRYLISGVQLGMLKAVLTDVTEPQKMVLEKVLPEIEEKQFVTNSKDTLERDVVKARFGWKLTNELLEEYFSMVLEGSSTHEAEPPVGE